MSYLYCNPENFGLSVIAEIDTAGAYEFDMVVLWRDAEGVLWAAHDSGCSCPCPFENHVWPTDYTEIRNPRDLKPLLEQLRQPIDVIQLGSFMDKVRQALYS